MRHFSLAAIALLTVLAFCRLPAAESAGPVKAQADEDAQDFVYLGDERPLLVRLHVRIDGRPLQAAWQDAVGKVFAYLDTNADGSLDRNEAERVPPAALLLAGGPIFGNPAEGPPSLGVLDANKDGKVSRAELADYYRRNGLPPFQLQMVANQQPDPRQARRVFLASGQVMGNQSGDTLSEKLFVLLDTNKDGKLSREELAAGSAILGKLDTDDDEMVSTQELSGESDANLGVVFVAPPAMALPQPAPGAPFISTNPGETNRGLARQLLVRYGSRPEGKRSRKLTGKDLGLDQAVFERLDADGDGELDAEELAHFARRDADLEFIVRLGKRAGNEPMVERMKRGEDSALAKKVRTMADGSAVLDMGVTRIELRGIQGIGPNYVLRLQQQYQTQFKAADRDNNGYLDRMEAQQSPVFSQTFRLMDRDNDGKLFEKEMLAYLNTMQELQAAATAGCASLSVTDQGKGIFDLVDANRDGRLGVRELRQLPKLVDTLDRDGDGQISRNEIPRSYQLNVRQGPANAPQQFRGAVVSRGVMLRQPMTAQQSAGPVWFRKMDRNNDGDVSRREFLGTDEEFRKIDTDGDGLISLDEAEQADRLFRKSSQP
jgi:Ca2+-binding EF-hand superfamily protein